MAVSFENAISSVRSIMSGTISGSTKFIAISLIAVSLWAGVFLVTNWTVQALGTQDTQQARFHTMLSLAAQYSSLAPQARTASGNIDVPAVFASVSERLSLASRVNRIAPDGPNQAVEITRLYAEELDELYQLLAARGVFIIAAELRALPAGSERLFTLNAIIGPEK
ncbi:MAG: hypothetical protein IJG37_10575 [Synergistaceae bacterium]|nr:hypothetical protein [Synergistaceae bacterium]MBQ3654423.1 hypothetical protein [Synergistaceae bacterium]